MRLTDHHVVGTKRQLRPNNRPPHHLAKIGTEQLGIIHTTFGRNWTIAQDTPDLYTDREDVCILGTTATYSDVTNLVMRGLKTADGLHQSYVTIRPDIEARTPSLLHQ